MAIDQGEVRPNIPICSPIRPGDIVVALGKSIDSGGQRVDKYYLRAVSASGKELGFNPLQRQSDRPAYTFPRAVVERKRIAGTFVFAGKFGPDEQEPTIPDPAGLLEEICKYSQSLKQVPETGAQVTFKDWAEKVSPLERHP